MRRTLLGALALLAVATVVALVRWRGGPAEGPDAGGEVSPTPPEPEAQPLAARPGGGGTGAVAPAAPDRGTLEAGPGTIRGVVLDPEGRPVAHDLLVSGWRSDLGGRRWFGGAYALSTDASGRFAIAPAPWLPPFWVSPRGGDPRFWAPAVRAEPGGPPVEIRLRPRPTVRVTVLDPDGRPVEHARVDVGPSASASSGGESRWPTPEEVAERLSRPPSSAQATTDASGVAVVGSPGEGPSALRVRIQRNDVDDVLPFDMDPWAPADTVVRLSAALTLEGSVRDAGGQPVEEGRVFWREADGEWRSVDVEYDGAFRVRGLRPGAVTIEPRFADVPLPPGTGRRTVAAGAKDVVLVVDFGADLLVRVSGWPREPGGLAYLTREGDATAERIRAEVGLDGAVRFRGLGRDATYTLWIPATLAGLRGGTEQEPVDRLVYRPSVKADDSPLAVETVAGRTLRVELSAPGVALLEGRWPPPAGAPTWADGKATVKDRGLEASGDGLGGRMRVPGVPEGEWTVTVVAHSVMPGRGLDYGWPTRRWRGTARAPAGDALVVVHMEPAPDEPVPEDR